MTFESELRDLINKYSLENGSDTPDFILASYLVQCLAVFESAMHAKTSHEEMGEFLAGRKSTGETDEG